jgi:hypothetical protein
MSARIPLTTTCSKRITVPQGVDPLLGELMERALARSLSWAMQDETLRIWFYRPPLGPRLNVVQRIGAEFGLQLAWVPIQPSEGD